MKRLLISTVVFITIATANYFNPEARPTEGSAPALQIPVSTTTVVANN